MKPAPRPRARRLLAGRFLVPRASLLALPVGPVTGLDLSTGELVGLAFGPAAADPAELVARIARWNELARPVVRDLHWHLGRALVSFDVPASSSPDGAVDLDGDGLRVRASAFGELLDDAGLGLRCGPADLALEPDGLSLRRPAIWPADAAHSLARQLGEHASRLAARAPPRAVADGPTEARPVHRSLGRCVPSTRRARLTLAVACAVLSALTVSSLVGSSHGGSVARAAPPRRAPAPLAAAPAVVPRRVAPRVRAAPPAARGGPARVLLPAPGAAPAAPVAAPAPAARATPAPQPVAEEPTRGWVAGLFAGS